MAMILHLTGSLWAVRGMIEKCQDELASYSSSEIVESE